MLMPQITEVSVGIDQQTVTLQLAHLTATGLCVVNKDWIHSF